MFVLQTEVALSLDAADRERRGEGEKERGEAARGRPWASQGAAARSPRPRRAGRRRCLAGLCAEVRRRLPAGPSLHPSGPSAEARSLRFFNIHLEKLNLASWKAAHRVKFLATSKVFHFPAPAMLRFPPVSAAEKPDSWACLTFLPAHRPRYLDPTWREGGAVSPQAGGPGKAQ